MAILTPRSTRRAAGSSFVLAALLGLLPASAAAQYEAPSVATEAVGERYHIEASGSFWNPNVVGLISSEQFGIVGSRIDLVDDLGYKKTRFKDLRVVLRATKKAKFKFQYTPVEYTAQTSLRRNIVFNGITFPVSLPIESKFGWKTWRFGYEYDVFYRPRGFVGFLIEGRYTELTAQLDSPARNEFAVAKAPLPAIGAVGRAYVLPELAINFQVTGFRLPDVDPKYQANYFDWDIHGTMNLTNYVGLQVGWRRMSNFLTIENDFGDVKFQGIWFGAAVRY